MSDDPEVPAHLIAAQRAYDAAEVALQAAVEAGAELGDLRAEVRRAVVALHAARTEAGPEWASWEGTRRIQKAARGE